MGQERQSFCTRTGAEDQGRNRGLFDAEGMAGMLPGLSTLHARLGKALHSHSFSCAFKEGLWSIWPSARESGGRKCLCAAFANCGFWYVGGWVLNMSILIRKCLKPDPAHPSSKDHFLYLQFQLNVEFLKTKRHPAPLTATFNLLSLVLCTRSNSVTAEDQGLSSQFNQFLLTFSKEFCILWNSACPTLIIGEKAFSGNILEEKNIEGYNG